MAPAPSFSPDSYLAAYRFAALAHRDQAMPGAERLPYLVHLGSVAMEVMAALTVERFDRPDLAVQCALLHDTLEDTNTTYDQLAAAFGREVADGALALTKDSALPKAERMADSLRRIHAQPREIWVVKLADRITNLQPPPEHWSADKRVRYRAEAGDILTALGTASAYLSVRMEMKIAAYAAYCGG